MEYDVIQLDLKLADILQPLLELVHVSEIERFLDALFEIDWIGEGLKGR